MHPTLISFSQSDVFPYQAEMINHLLKKNLAHEIGATSPANVEDRTPATHADNSIPVESEVDEEESGEAAAVPVVEVVPTC
jgi:hypothetical protein